MARVVGGCVREVWRDGDVVLIDRDLDMTDLQCSGEGLVSTERLDAILAEAPPEAI